MDRISTYVGQNILESNYSKPDQNTMVAIAKITSAMFGAGGMANGLACTQTTVPSMQVSIGQGELYQLNSLEATPCATLPADTTNTILKQGILLGSATPYNLPASSTFATPGTSGQSINYLIEAQYQDQDVSIDPVTGASPVVLNFYNSSNPATPWSGPNNTGTSSNTYRKGIIAWQVKAGSAATTGTQVTPTPDSGWIGLYVVTVAFGASTIVNANINTYTGAPVLSQPLASGRLLARRYITSTQAYIPTPGAVNVDALLVGAGGAGAGCPVTSAGQNAAGPGGAGGGWCRKRFAVTAVAGMTMTIGAGGTSVVNASGNAGGTTSFSTASAAGGGGGPLNVAASTSIVTISGQAAGGAGSGGDTNGLGGIGFYSIVTTNGSISGPGGHSIMGAGAPFVSGTSGGNAATSYGAGGSGGVLGASGGPAGGGAGAPGLIILEEYA